MIRRFDGIREFQLMERLSMDETLSPEIGHA